MSNPAAILSAGTSLSALLGGGAAAGGVTSATGAKGNNSCDFSSFLATPADQSGAATPSATTLAASPVSAGPARATPIAAADTQDDAPAPTGKNLPLAALASAVLPLPVTLTALTDPADDQNTPTAISNQDVAATGNLDPSTSLDANAITQNATLAMMAQAAAPNAGTPGSTSATPGFSLLSGDGDAVDMGSDTAPVTPKSLANASPKDQSAITLKAEAAMAMATPSAMAALNNHPGFSLTIETPPAPQAGAANPTPPVAAAQVALASADDGATAPGFSTAQFADAGNSKTLSARLTASRKSADRVSTANAGDNDQPGFTLFHSPTAPAANGASAADNAPNHDPLLAPAGAATQQPLQAVDGAPSNPAALMGAALATAAPQTSVQPTLTASTGTAPANDMSALVDRLVEARAAARSGLGAQTTLASISHTDFGRVSLRFDSDDSGMSISMSSKDPGFAPAAQAALAQQSGVNSASQGNATGQQGSSQHNSSQPGQQWAAANHPSLGGGSTSGGSAGGQSSGTGGQSWNQGNQNAAPATQGFAPVSLASTTPTGGGDSGPQRRSGILA